MMLQAETESEEADVEVYASGVRPGTDKPVEVMASLEENEPLEGESAGLCFVHFKALTPCSLASRCIQLWVFQVDLWPDFFSNGSGLRCGG